MGVNICTPEVKKKCAKDSMTFNFANPEFMELFGKEEFVVKYLQGQGKGQKAVENPEPQELPKQSGQSMEI